MVRGDALVFDQIFAKEYGAKSFPTFRALKIRETQRFKNPTKVQLSPHFPTYHLWITSGWSVRMCSRLARELYGENISRSSFQSYRRRIPIPEDVLQEVLYLKMLEREKKIADSFKTDEKR